MKTLRSLLLLPALSFQAFNLFCTAQTPPLPAITGTYYYEGFDTAGNSHKFISSTGTYYNVDATTGITTVGGPATLPVTTPYRAVIAADGAANYQFSNVHEYLFTVTTGTDGKPVFNFDVCSGTWSAHDTTFTLATGTDAGAILLAGAARHDMISVLSGTLVDSITAIHPVTFSGTNINAIVTGAGAGRRAVSMASGYASASIHGGTLSKTTTDTAVSETIYMEGRTEGVAGSSRFYGEGLAITSSGANLGAITMSGNTGLTLKNSTITTEATGTLLSRSIYLEDTGTIAGSHFRGENLTITRNAAAGRVFLFGMGENTVTLINSTVLNTGTGAAFAWNATTSSSRRHDVGGVGTIVTLQNSIITTTANYSPIFQMIGDRGGAVVTGGTLHTTGIGSTVVRLVGQNDATDDTRFTGVFQDATIIAENASAIDINVAAGATAQYGQAGGGGKMLVTNINDSYDVTFRNSTVTGAIAALRINAAGGHGTGSYTNFPYRTAVEVNLYDSIFEGGIEMLAGGGAQETSGAVLTFSASNSQIIGGLLMTAADAARLHHQAAFHVYDSIWTGDITLENRANLVLHFDNTPIGGSLSLSGDTKATLRLTNSEITGPVTATGNSTLAGYVAGTGAIGPLTAGGSATVDLDLNHMPAGSITAGETATVTLNIGNALMGNEAALPDGIHLSGSATLAITLLGGARLAADIDINDRSTFALATASGATATLAGNINLAGIWRITGKTTLDGNLTLATPLGTIAIENARPGSLTLANGLTGNGRLDILSIDGEALRESEIHIIHDPTGNFTAATPDPLILARPVDYGLAAYTLNNRPDGAYLVGGLASGSFGTGGAAVFNSRAMAVEDWFAALAPLNNRLAQLRQINAAAFSGLTHNTTRAQGDTGFLWAQARADTTEVDRSGASLDFTARTLGLTVGVDNRWDFDTATLSTGLFADTARTIRDFIQSADGRTTGAGGGVYAHYHHCSGIYASAIARYDVYENTLSTQNPNNAMTADYQSQAGGIALELGWRHALGNGWWIEPAAQIAFGSLPGISYTTKSNRQGNVVPISTADVNATQLYGRLALGKDLSKTWHLRGHLAYATINARGGEFTTPGIDSADFTIAGSRAEASLGIAHLVGRSSRVTLDAAYVTADDYKRPLTLSIGWSMAW